ncbi:hypothetical protein D929_00185 [Enterococcus faecalis 02-MB-P-10]|nr:hypothetical protein D929_00185 [Enterococcus faecalis 02-MB-P-10]
MFQKWLITFRAILKAYELRLRVIGRQSKKRMILVFLYKVGSAAQYLFLKVSWTTKGVRTHKKPIVSRIDCPSYQRGY